MTKLIGFLVAGALATGCGGTSNEPSDGAGCERAGELRCDGDDAAWTCQTCRGAVQCMSHSTTWQRYACPGGCSAGACTTISGEGGAPCLDGEAGAVQCSSTDPQVRLTCTAANAGPHTWTAERCPESCGGSPAACR